MYEKDKDFTIQKIVTNTVYLLVCYNYGIIVLFFVASL